MRRQIDGRPLHVPPCGDLVPVRFDFDCPDYRGDDTRSIAIAQGLIERRPFGPVRISVDPNEWRCCADPLGTKLSPPSLGKVLLGLGPKGFVEDGLTHPVDEALG